MYGTSAGGTDIPPKDEEEMKNGLPHIAIPFKGTTIKPLPKPGKPSEQTPKREITANGFVLDELYDTSAMDPCDVFFAYADVHNVSLVAVGVTEPNNQTRIRIVLNGSFPGSPTGVMQVPNPDRDFEATYSIMFCDVPGTSINLRVWKSGGGDLQTEAWREDGGGTTYYDNDPVLAESEIHLSWEEGYYDPNVKITPNHKMELEVASDDFFGPGSDPFDGGVCAYVESTADDSMLPGTPINDNTEEFVYGFVSACDIPSMYFIGPSAEPNGLGLGIAGEGLDANTPLEITLDDAPIGDCNSNAGGQFMFFMDNSTQMINGPHTVEVYQLEEHGDGTTTKGPSITGTFLYCAEGEPNGDFDGDCDVDFGDFSYFAANWLAGTDD
jgi:hypothetical protein